jgi:hypothetical protein
MHNKNGEIPSPKLGPNPNNFAHSRTMAFLFVSPILQNSRICCIRCNSIQEKELSQPMQLDPRKGAITTDATRSKKRSYHNRHLIDKLVPLAIEVFGCLNKHIDVFLHVYANAIWNLKGT